MRVMNQALTVGLDFAGDSPTTPATATPEVVTAGPGAGPAPQPRPDLAPIRGGLSGASGPLGRCALVYMDDCLVHSPTLEQHLLDVEEVLEIFRRRQLYAKSSKCEFGRQELGFLGHRLSKEGVSVDPRKMQSIVEWATPTLCCEVPRFTGLANYPPFQRYSELAAPLTALGSPTARFARTPEAQASFDALKQALSSAPMLRTFDTARRAVLTTDASNVAVAAILTQPDDEVHQHPFAYESRKLTALVRARWTATRISAAATFADVHREKAIPLPCPGGGGGAVPSVHGALVCSSRWQARSCCPRPGQRRPRRLLSLRKTCFSRRCSSRPERRSWPSTQFSYPLCAALRRRSASS